jgi:molybdopterin molybdotransferase
MISVNDAFRLLRSNIRSLGYEQVPLEAAVGRVLAEPVLADMDSPPYRKSLMDGYAIRSQDLNQGFQQLEVVETIVAGSWSRGPVGPRQAARIMTGAPIPEGADAVVMMEATERVGASDSPPEPLATEPPTAGSAKFEAAPPADWVRIHLDRIEPGKHIAGQGDNFRRGAEIMTAGQIIRPWNIGLLAEVGAGMVTVFRQPSITILPTGDELVDHHRVPQQGQIRNSNGPQLLALAQPLARSVELLPIAGDNEPDLREKISRGLQSDLLLLTGGVSAGMLDLVPQVLQQLGVQQVFHKIEIKPGKPLWFGTCQTPTRSYVFGLPGNPVSSLVGFHLFVASSLRLMQGLESFQPVSFPAVLEHDHQCRGGRPTYWPGSITTEKGQPRVTPLNWHGSSDLLSLGQANGLIHFPADRTEFTAGDHVDFFPLGSSLGSGSW